MGFAGDGLIDDSELRATVLDPQSPLDVKVRLLQQTIERTGTWPETCADFWNGRPPVGVPGNLPLRVCRSLRREQFVCVQEWLLDRLSQETPENAADRYKSLLRVLIVRCRQDEADLVLLTSALQAPRYTDELGRAVLRDGQLATELVAAFPEQTAQLGACAAGVLDQLWSQGRAFREHFLMVRTVQAALPQDRRAVWHAWMGINQRLQELAALYASPPAAYNLLGRKAHGANIREAGEALARDVERALAGPEYTGKAGAAGKAETIREIAKSVIAQNFPADFAACLTSALRNEGWVPRKVEAPAATPKPTPKPQPAAAPKPAAASGPVVAAKPPAKLEPAVDAKPPANPEPPAAAKPVVKPEPAVVAKPPAKPEKGDAPARPRSKRANIPQIPKAMIPVASVVVACMGFWLVGGISWMRRLQLGPGEQAVVGFDPEPYKETGIADGSPKSSKAGETTPGKRAPTDPEPGEKEDDTGEGSGSKRTSAGSNAPGDPGKPDETQPREERPDEGKPKGNEVAIAKPPENLPPIKRQSYEHEHNAHLNSVVVAERLPVKLGFGEDDVQEQRFTGWPDGIDQINVYGPTVFQDGAEAAYPLLKVTSSEQQLTISLARNRTQDEPVLRVSYEAAPSVQCVVVKPRGMEREVIEHLSTCVLEFRYPSYSRYGYLGDIPKEEIRDDKSRTVGVPPFCRWFGKDADWVAVSFWSDDSKGRSPFWRSFPCELPQQSGSRALPLNWEADGKGGKIVLPRQYIRDKQDELTQLKDVPVRLKNPTGKNWDKYLEHCKNLRIAPLRAPPNPRMAGPEVFRKSLEQTWNERKAKQILECDRRVKDINEEIARVEAVLKALQVQCDVAAVIEPQWSKADGRLQSGIVRVVLDLKLQRK